MRTRYWLIIAAIVALLLGVAKMSAQSPPLPIPPGPTLASICPKPQDGKACVRIYVRDTVTLKSIAGAFIHVNGGGALRVPVDGYVFNYKIGKLLKIEIDVPNGYVKPPGNGLIINGQRTWVIDAQPK